MTRKIAKTIAPPEVRLNEDGSLDEVVAFKAYFHLEQMAPGYWWMCVECGGKRVDVRLTSKRAIAAIFEVDGA